ncbi:MULTISPECIES: hypothetical protein [unclassified Leisingera]|uniref:hypothetical protein n=1 Tax=unclassified Leisingera TaxID=2614906 RepID=UPI00057E0876|nr:MULTISPECIES: hypothetical protein [unclassified Leisingera]KIC18704.1 hypothetical protein RA21_04255 [Leisingera sp. ANG-DT]KIC28679.1 hypothetical protein RA25_20895 [Leisingera sp. ANG-S5]
MNKMAQDTPFQGPPAPAAPQAQATQAQAAQPQTAQAQAAAARMEQPAQDKPQGNSQDKPVQPPRLSNAVLAQISAALRQGGEPLAAQADLVALHKRIAEMFTTLNEGLGERHAQKAAADRAALTARIDQLETAVNRMEGALRIEFEPVLKAAVAEALAQAAPPPRRRRGLAAAALLLGAAGLAAGVYWHAPLQEMAQAAAAAAESRTGWQLPGL